MLAPLLLLLISSPQAFGPEALQPYRRTSPDNHWALSVDPTARDGSGPAKYRFTHDGKDAWSGEKPWTFWDAIVTDDGFSAGYAYSQGGVRMFAEGEFHAVILAPDGSVRLDDVRKREFSHFEHEPPDPLGQGIFEQPDLRRIVFRIRDPDVNRRNEAWWCFRMPEAKEEFRKGSRDALKSGDPTDMVIAARGLPGTGLTLVEWRIFDWPRMGLRFSLLDAELAPVWDLARPVELMGPDDQATDEMQTAVYRRGTLLEEPSKGGFAIGLPKSGEKIRFAVDVDAGHATVHEIGREAWSLPADPKPARRLADLPVTLLPSRGDFRIATGSRAGSPIREVAAFDVSVPGVLRVVRREKDRSYTMLRVDASEKTLLERRVEIPDSTPDREPRFWSFGPDAWLATDSPFEQGARARAWRIEEATGDATPLADFDCPFVDDVAAPGPDRFVAIATEHEKYTSTKLLRAFDAKGALLWEIEQDLNSNEPGDLFSPEAVAVTSRGQVAVVDVIRHTVQFFDAEGEFRSKIELEKSWGVEPRYPCAVCADEGGGILVLDSAGDPSLYRMDADGTVRSKFSPRFPDGKVTPELARNARVGSDGRVWTTDGQRLLRLDANGVVDLQLGTQAVEGILAEPSAVDVDVFGRVLVQDKATCAVHVFDGKGKDLFVCRPLPEDFKEANPIAHLGATRDRGVLAQSGFAKGFVQFGPDGSRKRTLVIERGLGRVVGSPASDDLFATGFGGGITLLGADLSEHGRLERAPDGAWLCGGPTAAGPDGAVAVWQSADPNGSSELVLFEKPDPNAARALPLPAEARCSNLALGRTWAAVSGWGNDVLLVRRTDGKPVRFQVSGEAGNKESWRFGFDPEEDELIAVDADSLRIRRFALP
jgi:hypothetical protein